MKKNTIFLLISLFWFASFISCISMKSIELKKEKTTLKEAKRIYNDHNKKSSFRYYKEITNSKGITFTVYMVTEEGIGLNKNKTIAENLLNTTIRYLIFKNDEVFVGSVIFPTENNLNKIIEKY